MKYEKPNITFVGADFGLLSVSVPCADDIGSPSVRYNSKSVWDENIDNNETIDYDI